MGYLGLGFIPAHMSRAQPATRDIGPNSWFSQELIHI